MLQVVSAAAAFASTLKVIRRTAVGVGKTVMPISSPVEADNASAVTGGLIAAMAFAVPTVRHAEPMAAV